MEKSLGFDVPFDKLLQKKMFNIARSFWDDKAVA